MDPSALIDNLALMAEGLGIEVRFEWLGERPGGLCVLRGKQVLLVNEEFPEEEQAVVLGEALSGFDLEGVHVLPHIREFIARCGRQRP